MNVAASKVSFGMHNMPASEASPYMRGTAGPPQELEFGPRSALKFDKSDPLGFTGGAVYRQEQNLK